MINAEAIAILEYRMRRDKDHLDYIDKHPDPDCPKRYVDEWKNEYKMHEMALALFEKEEAKA